MNNPMHMTPCGATKSTSAGDHDPEEIEQTVPLQDGYTASRAFHESIRLQVEEVLPALQRDARYTLKTLCGNEFWNRLSPGERRMAGRCMAHIVVTGLLPLNFADSRHEYPKWYELK